jgi:hypothetical protein
LKKRFRGISNYFEARRWEIFVIIKHADGNIYRGHRDLSGREEFTPEKQLKNKHRVKIPVSARYSAGSAFSGVR